MSTRTKDMTVGTPGRLIFTFCLPIIIGNMFQQFYSLVDTLVVGRVEGVTALAAVSSAGWLDWTVLSLAIGLSQGFAIEIAQRFGAGDHAGLRRAAGQSLLLAAAGIGNFRKICVDPVYLCLHTHINGSIDMVAATLDLLHAKLLGCTVP